MWVKKNTSPKSKGEKFQQTNSPQKIPKRKYVSKKNTSPKSKGNKFSKLTHLRKIQREKYVSKKNYLTKI